MTNCANVGTSGPRPLHQIAAEILRVWPKPYFAAVPYVLAMRSLGTVTDFYGPGGETAKDLVTRFLVNAGTWRGEDARRIKAELREMTA